ncbi:MAG: hypothetical protein WC461_00185 [Candidatus Paceibacterota bacterium]
MVEKFKYGQFSLTPEEIEEAKKKGNLAEQEAKMNIATETLRVAQSEEAIRELENQAKEESQEKAA